MNEENIEDLYTNEAEKPKEKKEIEPIRKPKSRKFYIYSIIVFLLVMGLIFGFVMYGLIKTNSECVDNPFGFAAKLITLKDRGILVEDPTYVCRYSDTTFYFNKGGIYQERPQN